MKRLYPTVILLLALFTAPKAFAQVNLQQINTPYQQLFDSLAFANGVIADVSTLPTGWSFIETGTNANTTYATGTGSSNTGNTYSFGTAASTERALGGLQSGSLIPTIGARFTNNTGSAITSIVITYRGEQWRLGASARGADRLDFQYSLDASAINNGTWTNVDQLDFSSPITIGTVGLLPGNDTINNTDISFEITGLNIESGATFAIRWTDFNITSSDDGLSIDNFSLTPVGVPSDQPNISFVPNSLNFGDVNVNSNATLQYEVIGANLTDSISTIVSAPYFSISTDGINFTDRLTLPPNGDTVFVRFSPVINGAVADTVHHMSDPVFASLDLTGFGFEQASNIIPIAEARTKSVGTKVTVAGRITVANQHGSPSFVQDATGGIPVFDFFLSDHVEIGDSVIVTGPIGLFNDQIQISGAGIFFTLADSANRLIEPKPITIDQLAANEGLLVTVQSIELVNKSFVFYPNSTERMTNGSIQADLRIDGDTNIPGLTKPSGVTDITGVVGRFRTNAQLLPRFREDIPGAENPTTPFDSIPKSKTFDVVNWNLEFFGATKEDYPDESEFGPANEALQLENVKRVMLELNADIFAVQEVSDDSLFAVLVSQLGHYAYTCSDRFSYSFEGPSDEFPPQKVCFVYDTTTVNLVSARPLFEALYDSARLDSSVLPGIPGGNGSSFYSSGRLPYLATFNVTIEGVTETISLIDIHAKSGAAADDRNRRLYDATVLKDSLDAHFTDSNVIILGDLNDDLDNSITTGQPSPYAAFVTDSDYVPVTKALSDAGARSTISFNDVIDHQIITNDLQEEFLNGSQNIFAPFQLIANYGTTTTDHLAVITRYAFVAPEVNFVQLSDTVSESSGSFTVNIALSKPITNATTLSLAINGTASVADFTTNPLLSGNALHLNLPVGADSVSFTITPTNDLLDETDEVAFFTIQPTTGIVVGSNSVFDLTIQDNDVPSISFDDSFASAAEGSGAFEVKLKLSTPPATDQSATIFVLDGFKVDYGVDYVTAPAVNQHFITVQIPAGSSEASFTITPLADKKHEVPLELVTFFLQQTSAGLNVTNPRLSFFTIIDVKKKHALSALAVSPNPTSGNVQLSFEEDGFTGKLQVELRNDHGRLMYAGTGTLDQLSDVLSNKLRHERRGMYVLKVKLEDESTVLRILKKD